MFKKITTAAAVALVGLGVGAAGASAASISGGEYTSTPATHTFTVAGAYTHGCSNVTFEGEATGTASTTFTPVIDGCTFYGFPVFDKPSGPWILTAEDDPDGFGYHDVSLEIPAGTVTTLENPIWGYEISLVGPQTIPNAGTIANGSGGAELTLNFQAIYDAVGGPFWHTGDISYTSNGAMSLPGVTVQ